MNENAVMRRDKVQNPAKRSSLVLPLSYLVKFSKPNCCLRREKGSPLLTVPLHRLSVHIRRTQDLAVCGYLSAIVSSQMPTAHSIFVFANVSFWGFEGGVPTYRNHYHLLDAYSIELPNTNWSRSFLPSSNGYDTRHVSLITTNNSVPVVKCGLSRAPSYLLGTRSSN